MSELNIKSAFWNIDGQLSVATAAEREKLFEMIKEKYCIHCGNR